MKRALAAAATTLLAATALPAVLTAGGATAIASSPTPSPKSHSSASATIGAGVAAAVARGATDLIVGYDSAATIRSATSLSASGHRDHAARVAAAGFASTKRQASRALGTSATVRRDFANLPVNELRVSSTSSLNRLAKTPGVATINLPHTYKPTSFQTDLSVIDQPQAVAAGATGAGSAVAVIDTGLDYTIAGNTFGDCSGGPGSVGCRITSDVGINGPSVLDADAGDHGTNVAGIVADTAPEAKILAYGVFKQSSNGLLAYDSDILTALSDVATDGPAEGVRSVNLSLGNQSYYLSECGGSSYTQAFLALRALGIIPVVAAGNDAFVAGHYQAGVSSPACAPGALRVGAIYSSSSPTHSWAIGCSDSNPSALQVACFSQGGPLLSLYAPGLDVTAAGITESGTSQATPHVAAAVAMLASVHPDATAAQIATALETSGQPLHDNRFGTPYTANLLDISDAAAAVDTTRAEVTDTGCQQNSLGHIDDGGNQVSLPFGLNFSGGTTYSTLYVNNNGNVTFDGLADPTTTPPFPITATIAPVIAPFLADVDTRTAGSDAVTYGQITFGGRQALCVDWNNVGYYGMEFDGSDKLNSFQLLLVDRSDVAPGDFDIVMNYDSINWETGAASDGIAGLGGTSAAAGFSAGDGNAAHFLQFPGSLTNFAFLDTNPHGLANSSRGSLLHGRYIFPMRNGAPPGSASVSGAVTLSGSGDAAPGSPVQACPVAGGSCIVSVTAADGTYQIFGVAAGDYAVSAMPPAGSTDVTGLQRAVHVNDQQDVTGVDLVPYRGAPLPGTVVDEQGRPLQGASVTLLRADTPTGPFAAVPDGAAVMDPSNRADPSVTGSDGSFGWDVLAGYYIVTATKANCVATDGSPTASSAVQTVPSLALNLALTLNCNHAPVAVNDGASTVSGSSVSVPAPGLLSNDTDADGDSLTASLVTSPAHGTVALSANGAYVYTPGAGFTGTDVFTYLASDGVAHSAPATVSIVVAAKVTPGIPATTVALSFNALPVLSYNTAGHITASVTDANSHASLSGVPVVLMVRQKGTQGAFHPVAAALSSHGTVSFSIKPTTSLDLQLAVAASSTYAAATSTVAVVSVKSLVKVAFRKRSVTSGNSVMIEGTVAPKHAGKRVQLLRKTGAKWVVTSTTKTDKRGAFRFKVTTSKPDKETYEVRAAAGEGLIATASSSVVLHVRNY